MQPNVQSAQGCKKERGNKEEKKRHGSGERKATDGWNEEDHNTFMRKAENMGGSWTRSSWRKYKTCCPT